jgi:hypothetical protein
MIAAPQVFTTAAPEFTQIGGKRRATKKSTKKRKGKGRGSKKRKSSKKRH